MSLDLQSIVLQHPLPNVRWDNPQHAPAEFSLSPCVGVSQSAEGGQGRKGVGDVLLLR